jgi:hypothetical protein
MKTTHKTSMFACTLIILFAALSLSSCQKEANSAKSPIMGNVNAATSSNAAVTSTVILKIPIVFRGFISCEMMATANMEM